jgi:small subunit ribosomal protein S8
MRTDPLSDLIIRLKNAQLAGQTMTSIPFSELKWAVVESLRGAGYLKAVSKRGKKVKRFIEAELLYTENGPRISEARRISKPSRRVYHRAAEIRPVRQGYGVAIYSTSQGIMTDAEARQAKVGGEALFKIW